MSHKASPVFTGPYSPDWAARGAGLPGGAAVETGAVSLRGGLVGLLGVVSSGLVEAAVVVSFTGAIFALEPFTADAVTGGSSSTVYSRNSLPLAQFISSRKSRKGSCTASLVLMRMTTPLPPGTTLNSSGAPTRARDRPTRAKSSGEARATARPAVSSAPPLTWIFATSG